MNHCTERAHSSSASARSASESVAGTAVHWFSTMPSSEAGFAGRELRIAVAEVGRAPGFVVGGDAHQAVAEAARDFVRVLGEALGGVAVHPAAMVLQALRQVPVVEGQVGRDALFLQGVHQTLV